MLTHGLVHVTFIGFSINIPQYFTSYQCDYHRIHFTACTTEPVSSIIHKAILSYR